MEAEVYHGYWIDFMVNGDSFKLVCFQQCKQIAMHNIAPVAFLAFPLIALPGWGR